MLLREIAHARTGDKGDAANICVIAYRAEDYARVERHVTAKRVAELFEGVARARWCATPCRGSER